MKRWIKPTIIATTCLVPIGFVIGFATDWSQKTPISCVGSSGVKPFVEKFGNEYSKQNKKIDVTVDAGGSGFGINQIANKYCNIGNASKNPFDSVKTDFKNQWTNNRIKTITIAKEAISIVWIPPKGLKLSSSQLDSMLNVNEDNINDLFRIFSGFNNGIQGSGNLDEFCNPVFADWEPKLERCSIKPYVRAGGALTSGTASSFYSATNLFNEFNPLLLNPDQINALLYGRYGNDHKVYDTDEANSRAWEMFKQNNIPGSMVYLSSGFVIPNIKLIRDAGYGIMSYHDNQTAPTPLIDNNGHISDGYKWLRPLNVMLSLDESEKEKDFIKYIFEHQDQLEKIGAKPLSDQEKWSMVENTSMPPTWDLDELFNKSDVELSHFYNSSWNWDNGENFGAILV